MLALTSAHRNQRPGAGFVLPVSGWCASRVELIFGNAGESLNTRLVDATIESHTQPAKEAVS